MFSFLKSIPCSDFSLQINLNDVSGRQSSTGREMEVNRGQCAKTHWVFNGKGQRAVQFSEQK